MCDVGVHGVVPLLGPIQYEHEADIDQTVVGDSEDGILLHGAGAFPSNLMAVAIWEWHLPQCSLRRIYMPNWG